MHQFKVGDQFIRVYDNARDDGAPLDCHRSGYKSTVKEVTEDGGVIDAAGFFHLADRIAPLPDTAPARRNDPPTSKAAAAPKRASLRARVAGVIGSRGFVLVGWTGHEIADELEAPLNSVTPRLAELRRAGTIKDSGQRREGQIAWVLA